MNAFLFLLNLVFFVVNVFFMGIELAEGDAVWVVSGLIAITCIGGMYLTRSGWRRIWYGREDA